MTFAELQNSIETLQKRRNWYFKKCAETNERGYNCAHLERALAGICQSLSELKDRKQLHLSKIRSNV